jgi:anti-sigma factor RsiW
MHRRRWGPRLQTYVDGEAAPSRVALVERHVADCPDCAAEMELVRRMKRALARLRVADDVTSAVDRLRYRAVRLSS